MTLLSIQQIQSPNKPQWYRMWNQTTEAVLTNQNWKLTKHQQIRYQMKEPTKIDHFWQKPTMTQSHKTTIKTSHIEWISVQCLFKIESLTKILSQILVIHKNRTSNDLSCHSSMDFSKFLKIHRVNRFKRKTKPNHTMAHR